MHHDIQLFAEYAVTPFVGVWIETFKVIKLWQIKTVTPFVGVWIETLQEDINNVGEKGHTLRGCVD